MTRTAAVVVALAATLVTIVSATLGAALNYRVRDERTFEHTLRFAGAGAHVLHVRANAGTIRISGSSGSDVRVEGRQTFRARTDANLRTALREVTLDTSDGAATVDVVVRESGRTTCGDEGIAGRRNRWTRRPYEVETDLTVRAPRNTRLVVCSINGELLIDDIVGDFEVTTVNGRVSMRDLEGSGRASTVNGRIVASFARSPRDAVQFKTVNGELAVTFPRDLSADLRMKTLNGGLYTDFDVTRLARPVPALGRRRNGRLSGRLSARMTERIGPNRSNNVATYRVGGGGPELSFETLNGAVRILRAER